MSLAPCVLACVLALATPNPEAPLDRYFGTMQMSPIGIRQAIVFLGRNYTWRTMSDEDIVREAEWVEQSLYDWQRQFPRDNWLPPTAFHLMQLYAEVQTPDARAHALEMLSYIAYNWPNTKYGHLARVRLAQGFPPFHDEPPLRPTMPPATPSPSPTPETSPRSPTPANPAADPVRACR